MKPGRSKRLMSCLLLSSLLLGACSQTVLETPTPSPTSQEEDEIFVERDEQPTQEEEIPELDTYQVSNLEGVKSAVIHIESQGKFTNPEFKEYNSGGRGSGFIIDPSGLAVTNNHVVTGAALINVWIGDDTNTTYNAQILAVSECSDLALIDIEGEGFNYLAWDTNPITVGTQVFAAGFPQGNPGYTLSEGEITRDNITGDSAWASVDQVIEHDAAMNPGSSGGPLVSQQGQVIGVNFAGDLEENLYYSIGRDAAQPVIKTLADGDDVDSLGINGIAVTSNDRDMNGIWVSSVRSGSPADETGVLPGDLITSLEGLPLASDGTMKTYCDILRTQGDDKALSLEVMRFQTDERLEGQFNGRPLVVSGDLNGMEFAPSEFEGLPKGNYINIIEVLDDGYMAITDDSYSLYVEVPSRWEQVNGSSWSELWGDLEFEAEEVAAAPDLEAYYSDYDHEGISFSASRDWGGIGGYIMLLDGVRHWFNTSCVDKARDRYHNKIYEGAVDHWVCGQQSDVYVIGMRPINDPTAFLVLITLQIKPENRDVLDRVLSSFKVYYEDLP